MISRLFANPVIQELPLLMAGVPTQEMMGTERTYLVLDTNIVLEIFYWCDARVQDLMHELSSGALCALVSIETLAELADVLMRTPFNCNAEQTQELLKCYLALSFAADACAVRCKDVDDQKFLDLAARYACPLITRDKHLLKVAKKMRRFGVRVTTPEGL